MTECKTFFNPKLKLHDEWQAKLATQAPATPSLPKRIVTRLYPLHTDRKADDNFVTTSQRPQPCYVTEEHHKATQYYSIALGWSAKIDARYSQRSSTRGVCNTVAEV